MAVDTDGTAKLADFGASKVANLNSLSHQSNSLRGTPYWMAPEVVQQVRHCDGARCARVSLSPLASPRSGPNSCIPSALPPFAFVARQNAYGFKADIWSVGCTVFEMATGKPPWAHVLPVTAMYHIARRDASIDPPDFLSPAGQDLIRQCVRYDPADRPAASELIQHPFLTGAPMPDPAPTPPAAVANEAGAAPPNERPPADVVSPATDGGLTLV